MVAQVRIDILFFIKVAGLALLVAIAVNFVRPTPLPLIYSPPNRAIASSPTEEEGIVLIDLDRAKRFAMNA